MFFFVSNLNSKKSSWKIPQRCKKEVHARGKISLFFLPHGTVIFFILLIHAAMLLATEEKPWIVWLLMKVFELIEKLQKNCLVP